MAACASAVRVKAIELAQDRVKPPPPSLKKVEKAEHQPTPVNKRYDRTRNATFVNVTVPSSTRSGNEQAGGDGRASAWGVDLVFQLVYRGTSTTDLAVTYLMVEPIAGGDQYEKLRDVKLVEINAEGYQYRYERIDSKTDQPESTGDTQSTHLPGKAIIAFKLPPDDLSRMAYDLRPDFRST